MHKRGEPSEETWQDVDTEVLHRSCWSFLEGIPNALSKQIDYSRERNVPGRAETTESVPTLADWLTPQVKEVAWVAEELLLLLPHHHCLHHLSSLTRKEIVY